MNSDDTQKKSLLKKFSQWVKRVIFDLQERTNPPDWGSTFIEEMIELLFLFLYQCPAAITSAILPHSQKGSEENSPRNQFWPSQRNVSELTFSTESSNISKPSVLTWIATSRWNELQQIFHDEAINQLSYPELMGELYLTLMQSYSQSRNRTSKRGVVYTPSQVVNFMIGRIRCSLLQDDAPENSQSQRSTRRLLEFKTILDPACGGGAFLLGYARAIQHEFDYQMGDGKQDYHLLDAISNSLFGTDSDPQALRVTLCSFALLLKSEGHSPDEVFHRLKANFRAGNALTNPRKSRPANSSYSNDCSSTASHFSGEFDLQIDWQKMFPEVMAQGGFDIILGNPPYCKERGAKTLFQHLSSSPWGKQYAMPRMDLWYYFVHLGIELLKEKGRLCFITPAYWTHSRNAAKLRESIRTGCHFQELIHLSDQPIFENVSGKHLIFLLQKSSNKQQRNQPTRVLHCDSERTANQNELFPERNRKDQGSFDPDGFHSSKQTFKELYSADRINLRSEANSQFEHLSAWPLLGEWVCVRQGIAENPSSINTRTNRKYGNRWINGEGVFVLSQQEAESLNLSDEEWNLLKPYTTASQILRFGTEASSHWVIYSTKKTCPNIHKYPAIYQHLVKFRSIMEERRETKLGLNRWWHLHWPREETIWTEPKILVPQMVKEPTFCCALSPCYLPFSVNVIFSGRSISSTRSEELFYLTAILNSSLLSSWFQHTAKQRGTGLEINGHHLKNTPLPSWNTMRNAQPERVQRIVEISRSLHNVAGIEGIERNRDIGQKLSQEREEELDQLVCELVQSSS